MSGGSRAVDLRREYQLPGQSQSESRKLPMAEAEPKEPEASAPTEAATKAETKKERTPRLDWAGLLHCTFALDVLAC
jgi:hypothetical protein